MLGAEVTQALASHSGDRVGSAFLLPEELLPRDCRMDFRCMFSSCCGRTRAVTLLSYATRVVAEAVKFFSSFTKM